MFLETSVTNKYLDIHEDHLFALDCFASFASLSIFKFFLRPCLIRFNRFYFSPAANTSQHVQQTPPRTTSTPAKLPPQNTRVANKTTIRHTTPIQTTSSHTSKPTTPTQNSSTTVKPTQTTTTEHTPTAPNFGDVSQSDDSSGTCMHSNLFNSNKRG